MKILPWISAKGLVLFIILLISCGCGTGKKSKGNNGDPGVATQQGTSSTNWAEQSVWLLGYFSPSLLLRPPYSEWYDSEYEGYQPRHDVVEKLASMENNDLTIVIVLGIWCPDSRREVPRFMKIIDSIGFPVRQLTFIGVDNEKLSPLGDYGKLGIERVPTFIVYEKKVELGRIIENPVTSLEQDLLNILTGKQ